MLRYVYTYSYKMLIYTYLLYMYMSSWSRIWKVRRKQIAAHSLRFRSARDLQSAFGAFL